LDQTHKRWVGSKKDVLKSSTSFDGLDPKESLNKKPTSLEKMVSKIVKVWSDATNK